jgi:hypothetical protein
VAKEGEAEFGVGADAVHSLLALRRPTAQPSGAAKDQTRPSD